MNRKDTNNNEDIILDLGEENNEDTSNPWDVELDIEDNSTEETDTLENEEEETTEEETEEETQTETTEETSEDDIDLSALFDELDDANEALDKIEKTAENTEDISVLKQSLNNMEQQIKKLSNEKADLIYKNAELEAFGSDSTDPKILLLSRNLTKANDGDEKSKTKVISLLKDMLYDLTWEDIDNNKINKDIDLLSAVESYNSTSNPNLKKPKDSSEDDFWISI